MKNYRLKGWIYHFDTVNFNAPSVEGQIIYSPHLYQMRHESMVNIGKTQGLK